MQVLPLVTELVHHVEVRNQRHPMRLYGTLTRGAVWSCLNHVSWALPDLARILRWGVRRGLIERAEARRLWTLIRMLEASSATGLSGPPETPGPPGRPPSPGGPPGPGTHLHVLHGFSRPWQEWATEKINRNQEEHQ